MDSDLKREIERDYGLRFPTYNYTVNIDDRRRIAYFETPKVACTSIKKYMRDRYDDRPVDLASSAVHDRKTSPLKQLSALSATEARAVFGPTYRRFTFVRNPYTRILSAYLDKLITNEWERRRHLPALGFPLDVRPSFIEFLNKLSNISDGVRDIHYMTQTRLTGHINGLDLSYVGRFENFRDDFMRLKRDFFSDPSTDDYASFGRHHASNASEQIANFYGADEAALVRDIYAIDFIAFGYDIRRLPVGGDIKV